MPSPPPTTLITQVLSRGFETLPLPEPSIPAPTNTPNMESDVSRPSSPDSDDLMALRDWLITSDSPSQPLNPTELPGEPAPSALRTSVRDRAPSVTFKLPHSTGSRFEKSSMSAADCVPDILADELPPCEPPPDQSSGEPSSGAPLQIDNSDDISLGDASTSSTATDASWSSTDIKPPPGSMFDPEVLQRPISPNSVATFPMDLKQDQEFQSILAELPEIPNTLDSLAHIVSTPRVFGIGIDANSHVRLRQSDIQSSKYHFAANALASSASGFHSQSKMADGGSNICLTPHLHLLVDIQELARPIPISIAMDGTEQSLDYCCTKRGLLPIMMDDGEPIYQSCFYCKNAAETIISPQAILDGSDIFTSWHQIGYKTGDPRPGRLQFESESGLYKRSLSLKLHEGLYFAHTDLYTTDPQPLRPVTPQVNRTAAPPNSRSHLRTKSPYTPTSKAKQLESEIWAARMGFPGETQLDVLPGNVTGLPSTLEYHPFRFIDFKEAAYIRKQAVNRSAERCEERGKKFYMDFGFMRASAVDYTKPDKEKDRVVESYDGYNAYLIIVDEASRMTWIFLTKSKEPPLDIIHAFLERFGLDKEKGGFIRTDQGGELAKCKAFVDEMLKERNYVVEPTGADSPSMNGGSERMNDTLAVITRTLLYSSGLPAQFWSSALIHGVYLYNRRVHSETKRTPFEGWYGRKPDLKYLKTFGSRVCVKQTGHRRAKLDRHDFRGIFLGYTATDEIISYLDLDSGVVKTSHHAVFDEAWYLQPTRPPGPQMLYDLGLENEITALSPDGIDPAEQHASYPPLFEEDPISRTTDTIPLKDGKWSVPSASKMKHLPLRMTAIPEQHQLAAAAATTRAPEYSLVSEFYVRGMHSRARDLVSEFDITQEDLHQIYLSPTPYDRAFEETIELRRFHPSQHSTAGLQFLEKDSRLTLIDIAKSTPAAKIPRWRTRIRGAWLIKIDDTEVSSVADAERVFADLARRQCKACTLLFSHPEVRPGLSNKGLPILSREEFTQQHADQLNDRWEIPESIFDPKPKYEVELSGEVLNYVTCAMKLTRGRLLKGEDWTDWQNSEYLQLDQYDAQGMFGEPVKVESNESVFHLVWTYLVKAADGRKKARCTCDGSTRAGQVRVLDETYANCVDQTSSRLFYAIAAAENLLIFGSDVSNAFAEAGAPKQGFYIRPDKAFHEWWVNHKKRKPIPHGYVIPVLSAMQGHPESPRLWEKHADGILREIGLQPTVHEPCLYTGIINDNRVIFKRQVDDFAVACPDERTANILFDMIDDRLSIPLKRQGLLTMFNGMDLIQTKYYIKITCKTYLERICEKHLDTWMKNTPITSNRPTPLPSDPAWLKNFNSADGDPDHKVQEKLAKQHNFKYRSGVGEIIYAMTTARPDTSYAAVKLSQSSACPADLHYHGVKHCLKYLYTTRNDGIHFWRTAAVDLKEQPPPEIQSNWQDLIHEGRPSHPPLEAYSYADSDFATCPKTRRSFGGSCIRLAGGTVGYKTKFQPTVADSSTHAEFISAHDTARMNLFVRSVLWDLGIPQEAATVTYEDNDACTAMANARKPSQRTRHIDIKYFSLCEWVERDMITLDRIDTSINLADCFTKALARALFHRHADYILGHVPPAYSPIHNKIIGTLSNTQPIKCVPESFTTPTTAAAARIFAPINDDISGNPWATIVWHS